MKTEVVPFSFMGTEVRVADIDGVQWFVGKDVCDVLGYANPNKAMNDHCKGVTNRYPLATAGGMQEMRILDEGDLLRLVVHSRMPAAVRFERWVFDTVLPQIRKTGAYAPAQFKVPTTLAEALRLAADQSEEVARLTTVVEEQAPKVAALKLLTESDGTHTVTNAAKLLGMPPRKLFDWLDAKGWAYKRGNGPWQASAQATARGYLRTILTGPRELDEEGRERTYAQMRLTNAGVVRLAQRMSKPITPEIKALMPPAERCIADVKALLGSEPASATEH